MIDYIFRAYNTVAKKMYYDVQKGISINPESAKVIGNSCVDRELVGEVN